MFQSTIFSKLSRLALLSVFCAGLFVTGGELRINDDSIMQMGSGGVYSVMAGEKETTKTGDPAKVTKKDSIDETINSFISLINLAIGILTALITPLVMLAGWLLSPDWTFGEIFGLRPILHQLWILISNVVYVIFGFMLVFVAFVNIFGWEHSKAYEMKTMLPKLVTGMLIVPFTWFIVSATLSVANVLTASVIQLPVATILNSGGDTKGLLTDKIIPKYIIFNKDVDLGKNAWGKEWESVKVWSGDGSLIMNGNFAASNCPDGCISIKEFLTGGGWGAYNLLSVYAYGIFRIQEYKAITTDQKISKVLDIAYKLWYGVIFFVLFGILIIAIVYALFSRALMLWLYAMFSPLFALMYVTGSKHKSLEKFSIKEFVSLAMVPVYVSAALAFGLMFLGLVMSATGSADKTGNGVLAWDSVNIETKDSTTTFKFGTGDNGITLQTIGLLDPEVKNGASKALDIGKGIIGTIIMNVLALVILWMAVMAALGANKITEAAVKPIADMGDSVGQLMKNAPQYIPIPWTGGQSMRSVTQWVSGIRWGVEQNASAKAGEITRKFWFGNTANRNQIYTEWDSAISNKNTKWAVDGLHKMEKTFTDINEAIRDGRFKDNLARMGTMVDIKIDPTKITNQKELLDAYRELDWAFETKNLWDLIPWKRWTEITEADLASRFNKNTDNNWKNNTTSATTPTSSTTPTIPATPPPTGTTHMPVINNTHITVTGTAPIATGWTNTARTITTAQFEAVKTASGMTDADLKTQLASKNITVI